MSELFGGREICNPLCDFVQNKYVTAIPISPQAYDDDIISNSSQANLHIEVKDATRGASITSYKATVVYLCM